MKKPKNSIVEISLSYSGRSDEAKQLFHEKFCMLDLFERLACPIPTSSKIFKIAIQLHQSESEAHLEHDHLGVVCIGIGGFDIEAYARLDNTDRKRALADYIFEGCLAAAEYLKIKRAVFDQAYSQIEKANFRNRYCDQTKSNRSKTMCCEQWVEVDLDFANYSIRVVDQSGLELLSQDVHRISSIGYVHESRPQLKLSWKSNQIVRVRFGDMLDTEVVLDSTAPIS